MTTDACPTADHLAVRHALRSASLGRRSGVVDSACDGQRLPALLPPLTGGPASVTMVAPGPVARRYAGDAVDEAALAVGADNAALAGDVPYFVRGRGKVVEGDRVSFAPAEHQTP